MVKAKAKATAKKGARPPPDRFPMYLCAGAFLCGCVVAVSCYFRAVPVVTLVLQLLQMVLQRCLK